MELLINILIVAVPLMLGYFIGTAREKKHYRSIKMREAKAQHIPTTAQKHFQTEVRDTKLVYGNVVIAQDYFKSFLAGLRNIVGGRVSAYESLIDRGRREATLRLKEQAMDWGATEITHFRVETSNISQNTRGRRGGGSGTVEVMAYATAGRQ